MAHQAAASGSTYTKYASLPDVDVSAPDVYEYKGPSRSADASKSRRARKSGEHDSETDGSGSDSDPGASGKHAGAGVASDDIDSSSLRRNEAAKKFSGATDLDADGADFSGRLQPRTTRKVKGSRPRDAGLETITYAIDHTAGREGVKESVVDRLRRLKFEASQLEEELNASAHGSAEDGQAENGQEVDDAQVLAQLRLLQDQLAKLPSPVTAASSTAGSDMDKQVIRSLLQQVKQTTATSAQPTSGSDPISTAPPTTTSAPTDMVQLEARLAELESTLGVQEALLDDSKPIPRPVLATLSRLEHQLSLLSQPRHLDAISRRVKVLVTELDRVHEVKRKLATDANASSDNASDPAKSSTLTQAEIKKLQHLFEISTRLEPLLPLVPGVLNRLETLSEMHAAAAHFGSTLDDLEVGAEERKKEEEELEELLSRMENNMQETSNRVEANLESLQARIEELAGRLEKVKP